MLKKSIIILLCFAVHSMESKESVLQKIHKSKYYHRTRPSHKNIAHTSAMTQTEPSSKSVEKVEKEEGSQWTSGYEFIAGHRHGSGVGYNTQYSKFAFYKAFEDQAVQPFIDLRYLILNHGKPGANIGAGVGYQFANDNRLSAYGYFDVTKSRTNYLFNQITAGLSYTHPLIVSGKDWGEFTCYFNGYFPMKSKEHNIKSPEFAKFQGNHMFIKRTNRLALTGTNLELGYFSSRWRDFNLYIAGSAYYFNRSHQDAFGGLGKLRIIYNDLINAEVLVSGDRLFGTNVSGTLGIRIPLSPRGMKAVKARKQNLHKSRPIERFEPMVLDKQTTKTVARNDCGKALKYLFVNNACYGNCGTFEKSYSTLAAAENASNPGDHIYVFSGDGTTKGMDAGIVMQENQVLAGSGTALNECTQFGAICIPALTCNRPQITNLAGPGVTLARNNTINGITVKGASETGFRYIINEGNSSINLQSCMAIGNSTGVSITANGSSVLFLNIENYLADFNRGISLSVKSNDSSTISLNARNVISQFARQGGVFLNSKDNSVFNINLCTCVSSNSIDFSEIEVTAQNDSVLNATLNYCIAKEGERNGFSFRTNSTSQIFLSHSLAKNNKGFGLRSPFSDMRGRIECVESVGNGGKSFSLIGPNNDLQIDNDSKIRAASF
ncbi:MAG: hypothetical protein KAR79_03805 [Simkaniaceae bacterium]|nr:hypothetical protein [Simkaniaceae bacterium]